MTRAKHTEYKGLTLQSKLEARWALYLDMLNISWEYEPELVDLGSLRYLPDYRLPTYPLWLEVKGEIVNDRVGLTIVQKSEGVAKVTGIPCVLAFYDPLAAKCAVFLPSGEMYTDAHWGVCPLCSGTAILVRDGDVRFSLCSHRGRPVNSRLLYDAAVSARHFSQ